MKDYRKYEVHDFLNDDFFREWSKAPNGQYAAYWEEWLIQNPDRAEVLQQALAFLLVIRKNYTSDISVEEVDGMVNRLLTATQHEDFNSVKVRQLSRWVSSTTYWLAACFCLLLGIAWRLMQQQHKTEVDMVGQFQRWERKANETTKPITVRLSDGSMVRLEANSRLWYPRHFRQPKREVYLKGRATFDVAENQKQPFVVYTPEFITKVVGTRFRVQSCAQEGTATVTVKSGRVMVQPRHQYVSPGSAELVLVDNQQAVYFREESRIAKVAVPHLYRSNSHCM